ncbi:peptidoglycan-associated lipoprotein Pal [Steroidobacter sp.]|uniref:peptidoglycan-associated lipoprotein Pal n=1 Tax=Steroidobacter sp. TaxID=1978227 RepID=UPI001A539766|nr:peptidoglycan-associated lipoprotein Pal [Steroidobacter sp.]MBL8265300.1 peptidoglycan-associated lipoprotein Pal [Steroidobacter sp.]
MRVSQLVLLVASGLMMAACGNKPLPETSSGAEAVTPTTSTEGANSSAVSGSALSADQQALEAAKASGVIVYFDYDRAEIKAEFVPVVAAHAKYLNGNAQRKVRLEGHSDETGSREYNIGLGERRAQAVRRALLLQGVTENQITTVSYGEERPAVQGSDEAAYAKNRRVELVYGR